MPSESFKIKQYYANISAPEWRNSAAMVAVVGDNQAGVNSAVFFWFVPSGATLSAANVSAGGGESFLPFDRFSAFIDLLRNEEPMFCSYAWGVPDPFARIGTSAETPGEGE